jgi:hypothetical protein
MKNSVVATAVVLLGVISSVRAAVPAKTPPKDNTALVAALLAVSPDPLGGKLGLELSGRLAGSKVETGRAPLAAQPTPTPPLPRSPAPVPGVPKS